jgi:hypothetical protein
MFKNRSYYVALLCMLCVSAAFADVSESARKRSKRQTLVKIVVKPWGPTQADVDAAKLRASSSPAVQAELKGTKFRLIDFSYIENDNKLLGTRPPARFRAVFYDYTNDRTLAASGDFAGKDVITVKEEFYQPTPDDEEFNEAIAVLKADSSLGTLLKRGMLEPFRPMPDVTVLEGTVERLVNVGLKSRDASAQNEVVSVSIKRGVVIRYPSHAPAASKATPDACGIPNAGQATTSQNTAGQATLTVMQGQATLWEMLIIRPSASSGTRKSGIEVRDVKYKGKSVLKRGHAPVLNVQYAQGSPCGPYRDWQWQEGQFATPASGNNDIAPGIRIVAAGQTATTALESGNDTGNFAGVAIYTQNNDVVLVTEMQAGWYRYIMEWRFATDGTIRPRYGFGAVDDSCVCDVHYHHVYWRFDFDVVQPNNKVFQIERGRKFLKPVTTEMFANKNTQTNKGILVQNSNGDEAYELIPNITDGIVDTFGGHDLWVLRYKNVVGGTALQNEIDDGFNQTTSQNAFIQIDPFANGESTLDQDLVVWYGAHFIHSDGGNLMDPDRNANVINGEHVVGPDLRPVRW